MAEYIKREEAIKRIQKTYCADCNSYNGVRCRACGTGDAIDMIEDAPAADVAPVVLCKDCEKSVVTEFGKRYCKEPMGSFFGCIPVEDDYFCSGGRRKDGGDG